VVIRKVLKVFRLLAFAPDDAVGISACYRGLALLDGEHRGKRIVGDLDGSHRRGQYRFVGMGE
jgi:hypothetical protein